MVIRELQLKNFRNYDDQHLTFETGINVLIGDNAQGKTNVLEAIYLLAVGKSHRTTKDSELIQWGKEEAAIEAVVAMDSRQRRLRMIFRPGTKQALVNGVSQSKLTDFIGHLQVVLFAPEDLQLVKAGPSARRRFLNVELSQTQPRYLYHLTQYSRALQQRNVLLKQPHVDWDYVKVFDDQLVEHGIQILTRRIQFVDDMKELSRQVHDSISNNGERLDLSYQCSVSDFPDSRAADENEMAHLLHTALETRRKRDQHVGYTTVGPHRDDIDVFLNRQSVQAFASQGQQRTVALALRLAEIEFIRAQVGHYPVLLLDDVLSELDDKRQRNLVLGMSEKVQTILTTANAFHVGDKMADDGTGLFYVRSGIIQKEG